MKTTKEFTDKVNTLKMKIKCLPIKSTNGTNCCQKISKFRKRSKKITKDPTLNIGKNSNVLLVSKHFIPRRV